MVLFIIKNLRRSKNKVTLYFFKISIYFSIFVLSSSKYYTIIRLCQRFPIPWTIPAIESLSPQLLQTSIFSKFPSVVETGESCKGLNPVIIVHEALFLPKILSQSTMSQEVQFRDAKAMGGFSIISDVSFVLLLSDGAKLRSYITYYLTILW